MPVFLVIAVILGVWLLAEMITAIREVIYVKSGRKLLDDRLQAVSRPDR